VVCDVAAVNEVGQGPPSTNSKGQWTNFAVGLAGYEIAYDGQYVFVLGAYAQGLQRVDGDGNVTPLPVSGQFATHPMGVAAYNQEVYFIDASSAPNSIVKVSSNGGAMTIVATGIPDYAMQLLFDGAGNLYFSDSADGADGGLWVIPAGQSSATQLVSGSPAVPLAWDSASNKVYFSTTPDYNGWFLNSYDLTTSQAATIGALQSPYSYFLNFLGSKLYTNDWFEVGPYAIWQLASVDTATAALTPAFPGGSAIDFLEAFNGDYFGTTLCDDEGTLGLVRL